MEVINHYEENYADLNQQNKVRHDLVVKGLKQHGEKTTDYDELFKQQDEESDNYGYENSTTSTQMRVMRFAKPRDRIEVEEEYKEKLREMKSDNGS